MNRIIQFLAQRDCTCCAARRQYAALKATCEAIEADSGEAIEFSTPSVPQLAGLALDGEEDDSGEPLTLWFYPKMEVEKTSIDCPDLRAYAVAELRRIAAELVGAADAIEGGAV